MEGEKKRGWWALAGVGALTLIGGYVGAYYATVLAIPPWASSDRTPSYYTPFGSDENWGPFFWPIYQLDRRIRPSVWMDPPVNPPAPADDPPEISN